LYGQAGAGGGRGDEFNDGLVAFQWPAAPVHRDVAQESVFDLVPFAGAGREVADRDLKAGLGGEGGELDLPQPDSSDLGLGRRLT
jgi:hypothetical protein